MQNNKPSWQSDVSWLFFGILLYFCIGLGLRPYVTPSEARYIEIPLQMVASGDWLTPHINGVPYFEKPPLFYWLQAGIISLFGAGEFAGRFITTLFVTLTCLLSYACAKMLYNRLAAMLAAGVLATCLLGYGLSRVAMLDVPVTFFITSVFTCFIAAQKETGKAKTCFYLLMYACAALAVMTKGLIGIVIPGMVIGGWILLTKKWYILRQAKLISGTALFLLIAAPWHILMSRAHPEFLNFYFIHEHFTRFLTDEHKRNAPWWFFIMVIAVGLLPWVGLLPALSRDLKQKIWPLKSAQAQSLFLVLWIVLPFLFFSSSHSKLLSYIFPVFPPLAILLGDLLADYWQQDAPSKSLRRNTFFTIALFALVLISYKLLPAFSGKAAQKLASIGEIPLVLFAPLIIGITLLAYASLTRQPPKKLILILGLFGALAGLDANLIAGPLDNASVKPLTAQLLPQLQDDDMVVAYDSYWQDLPVYLSRTITVAGWRGELEFGVEHYPQTQSWMITTDEFWKRCAAAKHGVYIFVEIAKLDQLPKHAGCPVKTLATYGKTVLLKKDVK